MSETKLKLGSLFDGIAGFPLVGSWYGIEPAWASEIEEPCIRITKKHFPNMKHLGDITKLHGDQIEPVDVITGGSPCQDLSVAGKQSGIKLKCENCETLVDFTDSTQICPNCGAELDFTRSGLFMEQIRIIREMREKTNECYPKIVIWENVLGALSSNNGNDFFCVLQEFCKLMAERIPSFRPKKWTNAGEILGESCSIAWRLFDAQYWGVPQRRRRIFLVADFGGQRAGEILFKSESLRRHLTPSGAPWKRFTAKAESSIGKSGRNRRTAGGNSITSTLIADYGRNWNGNAGAYNGDNFVFDKSSDDVICVATQQTNAEIMVDKCPTLTAANGTSGSNKPYVVLENEKPIAFEPGASSRLGGHAWEDVTGTLTSQMGDNQMAVVTESTDSKVVKGSVYCIQGNCIDRADTAGCNGKGWKENVSYTLTTVDRPAVAYEEKELSVSENTQKVFGVREGSSGNVRPLDEKTYCLTTGGGKPGQGFGCVLIEEADKTDEKLYVAAFAHQQGGKMPSLPYGEEVSPTLISSQTMAVVIDNHSQNCRWTEVKDNICPTLTAAMGTGGNNTPFVLENPPEITPYGESGFAAYSENKVSTLKASGGALSEGSETLLVQDYIVTDRSHTEITTDISPTLVARDCKSPCVVIRPKSVVRRLTPLECERLQGL